MVTGIFCHYLPIYKDINGVYCSTTLTNEFFTRYFCVVDKLFVATRVYKIDTTFENAHQEPITIPNVKILEFPNLSNPKTLISQGKSCKKRLYNFVKAVALVFIRGGLIGIWGAECAYKLNKPYLVECAGCAWDEYWNYSIMGKMLAPYMELKARKITKNADFVVYVTKRWLQKRYPTKGISTYASNVMIDNCDADVLRKRLKKINDYDEKKKDFIIGTTGGIGNKAKGQQYVIEALGILKDKVDYRYELVGGGNDHFLKTISKKNGLSKNVLFMGQLTHEEVLKWLDSIDIYIQPSMQEGLPRALIEAMSRGCPAIGSTTGGIPELLEKKMLFKRGRVNELIKVIKRINKLDLKKQAIRNYLSSKEYNLSDINKRREDLYIKYRDYIFRG